MCATISAASPHYIRCLNPNGYKLPQKVDGANVLQQLRAAGLVEAVRVARQGFPSRYLFTEFVARFGHVAAAASIVAGGGSSKDAERGQGKGGRDAGMGEGRGEREKLVAATMRVLRWGGLAQDGGGKGEGEAQIPELYRLGQTKVFLKGGCVETLEQARLQALAASCSVLVAAARRAAAQTRRTQLLASVTLLAGTFRRRGCVLRMARWLLAAAVLQAHSRRVRCRRAHEQRVAAAACLQARLRCAGADGNTPGNTRSCLETPVESVAGAGAGEVGVEEVLGNRQQLFPDQSAPSPIDGAGGAGVGQSGEGAELRVAGRKGAVAAAGGEALACASGSAGGARAAVRGNVGNVGLLLDESPPAAAGRRHSLLLSGLFLLSLSLSISLSLSLAPVPPLFAALWSLSPLFLSLSFSLSLCPSRVLSERGATARSHPLT